MKETTIKVLGKITLPIQKVKRVKTKCLCDDCGCEFRDSWGNRSIEIKTFDSMNAKEPTSVRWVCEWCAYDLFNDTEPSSIFDGTPDYLRMAY